MFIPMFRRNILLRENRKQIENEKRNNKKLARNKVFIFKFYTPHIYSRTRAFVIYKLRSALEGY